MLALPGFMADITPFVYLQAQLQSSQMGLLGICVNNDGMI